MSPNDRQSMTLHEVESPGPAAGFVDEQRRRLPRVALTSEQFRLAANGKIFGVSDLSTGGMALRLLGVEDRALFPVGSQIDGWLNIDRRKHRVSATVRNLRGDHAGCEFVGLDAETRQALARWLDPADLGQAMKLMPTPLGMGGNGLDWIWFHGRSGTEILARVREARGAEANESLERMLVILWGAQYVEWSSDGVSTGSVRLADSPELVNGVFRLAPEWFEADATLDPAKWDLAKTLLAHSRLPEGWKRWATEPRKAQVDGS